MTDRAANEPFWMAPRRMRRLLEDGEVTTTEFALFMYVGVADGDRDGTAMTLDHLAGLLGCSPRTARRALAKLRELRLVSSDLRQGQRSPFRLLLGRSAALRPRLRPQEAPPVADVLAEVTSATGAETTGSDPATGAESGVPDFGPLARVRVETETETETKTKTSAQHASAPSRRTRGWPDGLGRRTLGDLLALCALVENLQSGADQNTLRTFVQGALPKHDAHDFDYVLDKLIAKETRGGVGTPPEPIQNEAAFAWRVLQDIEAGYEWTGRQ